MRRFAFALSAVFALALTAVPVDAQLKLGVHGALVSGGLDEIATNVENPLSGVFGVGGRLGVEVPLFPVGAYASMTYYLADSDENYWTASVFGKLGLPIPIISPYAIAGLKRSSANPGDLTSEAATGLFGGVGLQISSLFIVGTIEMNDEVTASVGNNPIVLKGGFIIG